LPRFILKKPPHSFLLALEIGFVFSGTHFFWLFLSDRVASGLTVL